MDEDQQKRSMTRQWRKWVTLFLASPIVLAIAMIVVAVVTEEKSPIERGIHLGVWTVTAVLAVVVSGVLFGRAITAWWLIKHDPESDTSECLVTVQNLILTGSLFCVHLTFAVVAMVSVAAPEDHWLARHITIIGLVVGQYGLLVGGVAVVIVNQRLRELVAKEVEEDVKRAVNAQGKQIVEIADEAREDRADLDAKVDDLIVYLKGKLGD